MADEDKVWTLAESILQAVVKGYADRGLTLPDRQLVTDTSVPTFDCEQLAVAVQRMFPGLPGAELTVPQKCNVPRTVEIQIVLTRCVAVPQVDVTRQLEIAPSEEAIQAGAQVILTDMFALFGSLLDAIAVGDIGRDCESVFVGASQMLPASSHGGVVQRVVAALV